MSRLDQRAPAAGEEPISNPRRGQKFCCDRHRLLSHQAQRGIPLAKLEERIRAIVREELQKGHRANRCGWSS
jgi:hypothetical protein